MSKTCLTCGTSYDDDLTFCPSDGRALRAADAVDAMIGAVIGDNYVVTGRLSDGGMGTVYHARHVRLPLQVAVKVLRAHYTGDPSHASRFRQEAEAASRIDHDRVARVYDFGHRPSGEAYIVMEYVPGTTLSKRLEAHGAIAPLDAAKIVYMVAEGLEAAHRLEIVHRDLKPENIIIVDDAGGSTRVKVLDFGIAKLGRGENSATLTQQGFIIGSPAFMSPEQVLGESVDARSDVFALGLVAFLMLTGKRAFTGETPEAEMLARVTGPARTLADAAPEIAWPADLQALFDRTLTRSRNARTPSAIEFATAMVESVSRWKGTVVPTAVMISSTWSVPSPQVEASESSGPVASTPTQHRARVPAIAGGIVFALLAGFAVFRVTRSDSAGSATPESSIAQATPSDSIREAATAGSTPSGVGASPTPSVPFAPETQKTRVVPLDSGRSAARLDRAGARSDAGTRTPTGSDVAAGTAVRSGVTARSADTVLPVVLPPPVSSVAPATTAASVDTTPAEPPPPSGAVLVSELRATVRGYADAIESRDPARMRAAFPGISPTQLDEYRAFFGSVDQIRIALTNIELGGALPTAVGARTSVRAEFTIHYRSKRTSKDDRSAWNMTLSRTGTGWQIVELR